MHDKYRISNAQAYDKSLLQKLDARRGSDNTTPPRGYSKSAFSSSASDASPTSRIALEHRHPTQLKPLSLPIITSGAGLVESPLMDDDEEDDVMDTSDDDRDTYDYRKGLVQGMMDGGLRGRDARSESR